MAYIKLVASFQHGLIITVSLAASQINGCEMSTKEPHRTTEESENKLKFHTIKLSIKLIFFILE